MLGQVLPNFEGFVGAAGEDGVSLLGVGHTEHGTRVADQSLDDVFGLRVDIPDLDGAIGRPSYDEDLVEYFFI